MTTTRAALAALLALAGCAGVRVTPVGAAGAPKPADCAVEFLTKAPERSHDEIAELESHVTRVPPEGPLEVLREPACKLGADAVVVTRNFVINYLGHTMVAGTAIRYRAEAPPAAAPETPPAAEPQAPPPPAPASD